MNDERWSPERVRAAMVAKRREGQLDAHGFFGGRVSEGWALRLLQKKGLTFRDCVVFFPTSEYPDYYVNAFGSGKDVLLSHGSFPVSSEWGPVVMVDRVLPAMMADPFGWVREVTSNMVVLDPPIVRKPMADAEFWDLIGVLGGEVTPESVEALTAVMLEWPYPSSHPRVISFWDALVTKLHELDHPENTVGFGEGEARIVSADASLYYRCEIVARGRDEFEARVREPRRGADDDGAWGEELLYVAENAASHELPEPIVAYETGTNPRYWSVPDAPEPVLEGPSPGPFSYEVQMARLGLTEPLRLSFTQFVAYTVAGDRVREILGCVMAESYPLARLEVTAFVEGLLQPGEQVASIQLDRVGVAGIIVGWSVIEIVRKSRLSLADYVSHYYDGNPLPAS